MAVPGLYRLPCGKAQPVATPAGLKLDKAAIAGKLCGALNAAVKQPHGAALALAATLGSAQRPLITDEASPLHGGEELGVLNNVGSPFAAGAVTNG